MILVTETVDILMREALRWLSALSPQEHTGQQVMLHGVSWETYERLLVDFAESHAARFAYDRGTQRARMGASAECQQGVMRGHQWEVTWGLGFSVSRPSALAAATRSASATTKISEARPAALRAS